ncbi:hypothetical protein FRC09_001169 [Ceratobasidium sp. 395]|nr:hypothetical protein FRC09_001169 [Ceratobasidium sp. 395]
MFDELKQSLRRAKRGLHHPTESGSVQAAIVYSATAIAASQLETSTSSGDSKPSALTALPTIINPETHDPKAFSPTPKLDTSPTEQNICHDARGGLKTLLSVLEKAADSFSPFKVTISGLSTCIEILEQETKARQEYENLLDQLNKVCKDLAGYLEISVPSTITPITESIMNDLEIEIGLLQRKVQTSKIGRYIEAMGDIDEVIECYRRIYVLLGRITLNANVYTWKTVDEQATDLRLQQLPNTLAAKYKSAESQNLRRVGCAPNTRIEVLEALKAWASDGTSEKIYWLNGMAGTGKTTIAYSFCDHLQNSCHLGASFFCSRQLPACRDVNRIIPTISYQLALFSSPFRHSLSQVLEKGRDVHNQPIKEQFQHLVAVPLQNIAHTFTDNVIIVIDALDECEDKEDIDRILDTLISHVGGLPVKFFVSSRPEAMIMDRMRSREREGIRSELRLHELERTVVQDDINTYLRIKLKPANVSDADFNKLAERSGVLFIYAATVVRYIEYDNFSRSAKRLRLVLDSLASHSADSDKEIDKLYTTILEAAFDDDGLGNSERAEMEVVLNTVLCAQEPLSVDAVAELLGLEGSSSVQPALRPLLSVLNVSKSNGLITTLHESFPNYMFNQTRSKRFYCDMQQHNTQLARLCFDRIESVDPAFNICKLESSYVFDEEVPELAKRIEEAISSGLFYACQYWGAHLGSSDASSDLSTKYYEFLSLRLLLWMEVMNLKRCLYQGAIILYKIQAWCKATKPIRAQMTSQQKNCQLLTRDAYRFLVMVSSGPLSRSTPHIYISALRFWPEYRPVSSHYLPRLTGPVRAIGQAIESRPEELTLLTIVSHTLASCAAYSPDGQYIVSNFGYQGLGVWEAQTGRMVGQLEADYHNSYVNSVAYSPTGTHIASGSDDGAVRIWDAREYQLVGEPLRGHSTLIHSVAYSPDGARIASGSETICIWDAYNGQMVIQLLEGHDTNGVSSVTYSPNGLHIVSGGFDRCIVIWDACAGTMTRKIPGGVDSPVFCVAYSPDGMSIAFGLGSTINIWSVNTGQLISQAFQGHLDAITSIDYSPDGGCIVSGSYDGTVRIWNAHTGQSIGQPLQGHNREVHSVAYSPDGTHILSSSSDETIRIWDAQPNQIPGQLYANGHLGVITSVVYSPNGARIVSSSDDKTICIWDTRTGQIVGEPMKSKVAISSVAYSPDGEYIASGASSPFPGSTSRRCGIYIWDLRTGNVAAKPLDGHTGIVTSIVYSPDGAKIASASSDKTIRLWDVHEGQMIGQPFEGHTDRVNSIAYSPGGEYLVSGSNDRTVRIWEVGTGQEALKPLTGHTHYVSCVAFSPNGKCVVSGCCASTIRIWDVVTGEAIRAIQEEPYSILHSIAYSPNGAYIVSGSFSVSIWDAQTGQLVGSQLKGHTDAVKSLACSPDNTYIASSGSWDKTIRIWRVDDLLNPSVVLETQELRLRLTEHSASGKHALYQLRECPPHLSA